MKRIGDVVFAMVMFCFLIGVGSASAATLCFKDTQYSSNLLINVVNGGVLVGYDNISSPGSPLTGIVSNGTAFFSIAYTNNRGLRFYQIDVTTLTGTTWGASSITPGTLYDNPHSATMVTCIADSAPAADSGAAANSGAE